MNHRHRYGTRWEVVMEGPNGRERLGFSSRRTKGALLGMIRDHIAQVFAMMGEDRSGAVTMEWTGAEILLGDAWSVRFGETARTVDTLEHQEARYVEEDGGQFSAERP